MGWRRRIVDLEEARDQLTSKRSFTKISTLRRVAMRLRAIRTERGWTQQKLAKRAHISRVYLNKLETRKQDPRLSVVAKLASALKVKIGDLVD